MRSASVVAGALALAGPALSAVPEPLIDPHEQRPLDQVPIRVSSHGNNGFTHVQFPIACSQCFPEDPQKPKNYVDGLFEFDVRITRSLGLDGENGAQINGYTVLDEDLPVISTEEAGIRGGKEVAGGNVLSAVRLFSPSRYDSEGKLLDAANYEPEVVGLKGSISIDTLVKNSTHDVKGIVYNITSLEGPAGPITPAEPAGFRLSYSRRPDNSILRIQQGTVSVDESYPFEKVEEWIHPGDQKHFTWAPQGLDWINKAHDRYAGWDQYFVTCKTTACRVNKIHTKITSAYDECLERWQHPENFLDAKFPPQCHAYLIPHHAKNNIMLVGAGVAGLISTLLRMRLGAQKDKVEKQKKQKELDEKLLEQLEDDAVAYLMNVEGKNVSKATAEANFDTLEIDGTTETDKEGLKQRK
ncbi:uncharacterized protein J3D65DRAFT_618715 [Phyllosticta citribraziliensis]|uniref:Uncharacterized protein n=1 Tax=Phyllosticta citribraziliensis TaxID=989973 RepID=A0ABR1LXT4_9PEZI